ncbi:MAG: MFS transporter [Chloroflexi bacterium]|nr:MFS transporter [Chloroflexota bacterium]
MKNKNVTLVVFTLMNFVLAMLSFVFNGILDQVAVSLNISISDSGLLTTMYLYGAAFGVPISLILFRKIERIRMLKIALLITILMTFALVLTKDFTQLLIIRLITGISSISYSVLAISTVMAFSSKERQGRSMAFLIMGNSLALVIGIPLTRALSAILDWRSIFWILNVMMTLSLIYFQIYLTESSHASTKLDLGNELKFFKDGKTVFVIIYTLIMFVGYGAFYTYVTPYLLYLFPSLETIMSILLVLLGIAGFTGNLIGGHVSDRIGYARALLLGAVMHVISIVMIFLFQSHQWLSVISTLLWLMSSWFIGLQLNTGIAQVTQNKSSFMISLNTSAIQLGSAIGSSLAAIVISQSGMQNIVFITLLTSLGITITQIISNKKYLPTTLTEINE